MIFQIPAQWLFSYSYIPQRKLCGTYLADITNALLIVQSTEYGCNNNDLVPEGLRNRCSQ